MQGYRFPKYALTSELTKEDLCTKLDEEVAEAKDAIVRYDDSRNRLEMLMEVCDVIHVCETILQRFNVNYTELNDAVTFVTLKNQLRGYYAEDTRSNNTKNSVQRY